MLLSDQMHSQFFLQATYSIGPFPFSSHIQDTPSEDAQRAINVPVKSVLTWFTETTRKYLAIVFKKLVNNFLLKIHI